MRNRTKLKYFLMAAFSLLAVMVTGVSTLAWFQINTPAARTTTMANDDSSISMTSVTGYKYERDQLTTSTVDYNNGSVAAVNYVGNSADNNIQEGVTTELDIPPEGMGYYVLNSYNDYKKSTGFRMENLTGDSKAKIENYPIAAGESIKFFQHASDQSGNTVDYNWNIRGIWGSNDAARNLISAGKISLSDYIGDDNGSIYATISFGADTGGTYYLVLNNSGQVEVRKDSSNAPSRSGRAQSPSNAKKGSSNRGLSPKRTVNFGTTIYLIPKGGWLDTGAIIWLYYWNGGNNGWVKCTDTSATTPNGDAIYTATIGSSGMSNYILVRKDPNHADANNGNWGGEWNRSGDQTWSGTNNVIEFSGFLNGNPGFSATYSTGSLAYISGYAPNGYVIVGNGPTFNNHDFYAEDAIIMDDSPGSDAAVEHGVSLQAGDKFKITYRHQGYLMWDTAVDGKQANSGWGKFHVSDDNNSTLLNRYFKESSGNIEVRENFSANFFLTSGKDIYVNFSVTLTVKGVKYDFEGTDLNDATHTAYSSLTRVSEAITLSSLNSSLSIPSGFTRDGTAYYSDSSCNTSITSASISIDTTIYIKLKGNAITITLCDSYYPDKDGTNRAGVTTKTVSGVYGASTSHTAQDLKNRWDALSGTTSSTYTGGCAYGYKGIYTDAAGTTPFTSGVLTANATYYVCYHPVTYTLTRQIDFYLQNGTTPDNSKSSITSLSDLSTNSITNIDNTSPHAQGIYNDVMATYGYEFDAWFISYDGNNWQKITNATTKPTGNGALSAHYKKCEEVTLYIDVTAPVIDTNWTNWTRSTDVRAYAFYGEGGQTIRNGQSNDNNFGVSCTRIFQFYYKIVLPKKAEVIINCNHTSGNNQTGQLSVSSNYNSSTQDMIILGSTTDVSYNNIVTTWGKWNDSWNPLNVDGINNNEDTFLIHFYDTDGLLFDQAIKMTNGGASGHESTDQAHKLQIPLQAGTQFVITRLANGSKNKIDYVYGHESIGMNTETNQTYDYDYEDAGDALGSSSAFGRMLWVSNNKTQSGTVGMHMFKITISGVYDIFINQNGDSGNRNKVFFDICELRVNYSTNKNAALANWNHEDMYLGDQVNYFSILEQGIELDSTMYVFISVKSNKVISNYGFGDLASGESTKGYCEDSGTVIPSDSNSKHSIHFKKKARYAVYVQVIGNALKVKFEDMPEKGEGYYICQNDSSFYSFGKSIKMREVASPSSYKYQYKDYVVTANSETIKLKGYAGYSVYNVTSLTNGSAGSISNGVITLAKGMYDIFIDASNLNTARIVSKTTTNYFKMNSYTSAGSQDGIKSQNTSLVFKITVTYSCNFAKTIKFKLGGTSPDKFGMACSAVGASYTDPYNDARTNLYATPASALTVGTTAIDVASVNAGNNAVTNQTATFYVLVDYLYDGNATSSDSFKLIVSLA